jgi:hypothetical protein
MILLWDIAQLQPQADEKMKEERSKTRVAKTSFKPTKVFFLNVFFTYLLVLRFISFVLVLNDIL